MNLCFQTAHRFLSSLKMSYSVDHSDLSTLLFIAGHNNFSIAVINHYKLIICVERVKPCVQEQQQNMNNKTTSGTLVCTKVMQ